MKKIMRLYDLDGEKVVTLPCLFAEWEDLKKDGCGLSEEETESFPLYLCDILQDTLNGRNNCEIIGNKPEEIIGIYNRIKEKVFGKKYNEKYWFCFDGREKK